jgi:S-adenosylmethionine hydrolase
MQEPTRRIALLTDFGSVDTYVGVMKGVISGIAPHAEILDVNHGVPPGDIRRAAFQLWQAVPYFPQGTIFVVVVDPGVGTARRPLAVEWETHTVIAPDNGVLTYLMAAAAPSQAVSLDNPDFHLDAVSTTFHGRDVFSPAAAHLGCGVAIERLGSKSADLVRFPLPTLSGSGRDSLRGEILHLDHFGNAVTSLGRLQRREDKIEFSPWLPTATEASLPRELWLMHESGLGLPLLSTFGDIDPGRPLAYIGSESLVEIAVNRGHAGEQLGLSPGQSVQLQPKD